MMNRRSFQLDAGRRACAPMGLAAARRSPWPDKPIKLVLSQPAGSGPDNIARMLGDGLAQSLGQPFVIDNKPGGQNVIGAQAVKQAPPDGYTFYFATTAALVTNSYLFKTLPYDPLKDFAPVGLRGQQPVRAAGERRVADQVGGTTSSRAARPSRASCRSPTKARAPSAA